MVYLTNAIEALERKEGIEKELKFRFPNLLVVFNNALYNLKFVILNKNHFMQAFETSAVFDKKGKLIIEDMPSIKNKKVKLLFLIDEEDDSNEFYDLSIQGLSKAYSDDETEYDFSMIKERNPLYKNAGR